MGRLKDEEWFKETQMTELHKELLIKCLNHDFYWVDDLVDLAFAGKWYERLLHLFYRLFIGIAGYKAKRAGIR